MMTSEQQHRVLGILKRACGTANFDVGWDAEREQFWVGIPSTGEKFLLADEAWAAGLLTRNHADAVQLAATQIDLADQRVGPTSLQGQVRVRPATGGHGIDTCACGAILRQCRCPGPHTPRVTQASCPKCEAEKLVVEEVACGPDDETNLHEELRSLLNRRSRENASDTPDFILAEYMLASLTAFEAAVVQRERWYGRKADDA